MSGKIPNLWPEDFGMSFEVTPKAILQRQAQVLNERTKNQVQGVVKTRVLGRDLQHTLSLVTPGLDDFEYVILRIRHSIGHFYPLKYFITESDDTGHECEDEQQLYDAIRQVLQDERTISVVRSLYNQSG